MQPQEGTSVAGLSPDPPDDPEVADKDKPGEVSDVEAEGWDLGPTHANFVFLPTGQRTDEVALALEKQGVVVRPFSDFGIRITISTPEENDRWLEALRA